MRSRTAVAILPLVFLLGLGCGGDKSESPAWDVVSVQELTPAQIEMGDRARSARDDLFSQLSGRLTRAVAEEGPAAAISVCAEEAPNIAAQISQQHGLAIGRTSFRLRNPQNAAPAWAASLVSDRVEEETYLAGSGGELGILLPIRMNALCVTCHGTKDDIPGEVQDAIAQNYPADEATGFAAGDLRGWFWIEVKPSQ